MLHFKLIPPSPASYLPRNRTVLPPYLYREAKYGADTDQVRFRHGPDTERVPIAGSYSHSFPSPVWRINSMGCWARTGCRREMK